MTHDGYGPVYSPNGRKIAFESTQPRIRGIFVIGADGRHRRRLTTDPYDPDENGDYDYLDYTPDFAPDGKRIVFVRAGRGCALGGDDGNLFVMGARGGNATGLTDGGPCGKFADPEFSPDGSKVVTTTGDAVVVMHADGTHRRKLTHQNDKYSWAAWQPRPKH